LCDLGRVDSVRRFAERFTAEAPRLDVLVNNAGVLTQERERSADGIELTLATNVIAPFLLTQLLIPMLEHSAPSRIVNVSSGGMYTQKLRADDLQSGQEDFDGPTAYARTKRAEVVLSEMWAQRLAGTGVTVHAMRPGWADTPGVRSSLPRFYRATRPLLRSPHQGADTIVWLGAAAEPAETSGGFWHDRRRRPTHLLPGTRETEEERGRLWSEYVALSSTPAN
jgi:dehydrogenase/reductase SDR family member 12